MWKIVMKLAAAAALLFGLAACDLDLIDNYTFSLSYECRIEDEEAEKELKEYLDDFIKQPDQKGEYQQTPYADAVHDGMELFDQILTRVDRDFILDHIQSEDDIIRMAGVLSGDNIREVIAQIYWTWEWKQSQLPPAE